MPSTATVRAIEDPAKRARAAARIVRDAEAKANEARYERDMAAVILHLREGWKPVEVYRALGVSRGLFVRMVQRAPADLPPMADPDKAMRKAARTVERLDTTCEEAREVRDEAAAGMLAGKYRKPDGTLYRNADVARLTGLTTARIAQLRAGRR